jgi:hypothetical protein
MTGVVNTMSPIELKRSNSIFMANFFTKVKEAGVLLCIVELGWEL